MKEKLARLGILSPWGRVLHLPIRYEDETRLYPIKDAPQGESVLVEGEIVESGVKFQGRRILSCRIEDGSGALDARFMNFYPSQVKALAKGKRMRFFGEIRAGFFGKEMIHPKVSSAALPLHEALTPIYPTTAGLSQKKLKALIDEALESVELFDTLPDSVLARFNLEGFEESVRFLHDPSPEALRRDLDERTHPAWVRMKFDELLAQQLSLRLHYRNRRGRNAPVFSGEGRLVSALLESLAFELTKSQKKVFDEICRDLAAGNPMQRLLQGDVGSGKTIVAALAALLAIESGFQAAIMAPTEILAEQHYDKFSKWLKPLGLEIAWLASSLKKKEKEDALSRILLGEAHLAIGTHALFQEQVVFRNLGLAVIDEQHRFGVHQRLALRLKGAELEPHQLMMSATPIPRTLAMSYYADLDVSVIDELPPGRTPVTTKLVSNDRREEVIRKVRDACLEGSQAYWVCPLIEESESLQLQTAMDTHARLVEDFPEIRVGLVHGRMPNIEKAAVMRDFQDGRIKLLVATTVIEVGVDVPNASVMVIEHAERMGLSQLHQLRGRVGRGSVGSVCLLLYQGPLGMTAKERLKAIFESSDGFEISRRDLALRGPGEFMGVRQSGVPMLKYASVDEDEALLEEARGAADMLLEENPDAVNRHLERWLGEKSEYLRV
ncbi:MAG: ATP-dependent DNA helicase RecG [Burkholderiales bacterium]|nr:ATP-dependent DNA helicase RecG [Burkholderiales bacterium]